MRSITLAFGLVAAGLFMTSAAHAQHIKTSGINGIIESASKHVPDGESVTLFTTPSKGTFVMTDVCAGSCVTLEGEGFGPIPKGKGAGCSSTPPLAFPAGDTITCTSSGTCAGGDDVSDCTMSGIEVR